jgi:ATP-dependent exoDNAse (exonuclease V) beta subunit
MSSPQRTAPPDQDQRERALDPRRSVLVQAPAGSGKTDLLTRRFLRLLSEVEDPAQIVAITFTKAAAAEMRHRIVAEIEKAETRGVSLSEDEFSIDGLARRALQRSRALGWDLINLQSQLRISTIDSFCRELALQRPLLSGLGGGLDIAEQPRELYRRAARRTLEQLGSTDGADSRLREAIETLLLWRDNNWQDIENQLVEMLGSRDRWMQDFVFEGEPDWDALREKLERPLARVVANTLERIESLFAQVPDALEETVALARFACDQSGGDLHQDIAERAEFPCCPFLDSAHLEEARLAWVCAANLLLTGKDRLRQSLTKSDGFPQGSNFEKSRFAQLANALSQVDGLEPALAAVRALPAARYTEEEWAIVRASFLLLRRAAGELRVVFAEAGKADYIEVAQLAQRVLEGPDEFPSDAAIESAARIHHLLVDEFQDTSRRQHKLIAGLVAAWPDTAGRTVFVVGDPMQSIYLFRDADAELFPRVKEIGLELPVGEPLHLESAPLASNFRTAPQLVDRLNDVFTEVFRTDDGSRVRFSRSQPSRAGASGTGAHFALHLEFIPQTVTRRGSDADVMREKEEAAKAREEGLRAQTRQIIQFIRRHRKRMERAQSRGEKYRIAVLGRTRAALAPVAQALRDAAIPFRAVDLEPLAERQEVLDVLALARALLNGEDRVAWLGVLRAPWCGLSLTDLHLLAGADDPASLRIPLPALLRERTHLLSPEGQQAAKRVMDALDAARAFRSSRPELSIGAWLQTVWKRLGGADCVTPAALVNVNLLWKCLDALPGGEADLMGSSLNSALESLTAQPDPDATSEWGVQLMTIHKSKGLEFEVVIVPELQGSTRGGKARMLTWLERGLEQPDDSGAITEFLIAPFQPKGEQRGRAKQWVDREYKQRERQEIRRILYVAATRAREELHLFARPEFRTARGGERVLCNPRESLLSTAWPALQAEVQSRFAAWSQERDASEVVSLAAAGENNLIQMALPFSPIHAKPAILRRLPFGYHAPPAPGWTVRSTSDAAGSEKRELYQRHEGGAASRALGSAVHALFEELARLLVTLDVDAARSALAAAGTWIAAQIQAVGISRQEAQRIGNQALAIASRGSQDAVAAWILAPRASALTEARWTGLIGSSLHTVQVDRVFRAGATPGSEGEDTWWIVDYKTAYEKRADTEQALRDLREIFAPQLHIYAAVLRNLHGTDARVNAGLYYPRMMCFDWWEIPAASSRPS